MELIEEVNGVVFSLTNLNIVELVVFSLTDQYTSEEWCELIIN